jgi:uncharacterized protein YkwD
LKRKAVYLLPLSVLVCLLAFVATHPAHAQSKITPKAKTGPKSAAAPKAEIVPKTESVTKSANTAALGFMSQLEREIIDEMNLARTEPQKYAAFIEEYKKYYNGNRLTIPGRQKAIVTNEGITAVDEAITYLRATQPLPGFEVARGVCSAASDHAKDLAGKGFTGHRGSDGSTPNARVDRYGQWEAAIGETVVYEVSTARQIIISLIIDDGVPNRGHRRNIFDANYHVTGISVSDPLTFGSKCVIDYVGGFKEKAADPR